MSKLKDMLKPIAIRWVESRSEVERLERKVQQMRALLEHQTRVNEQYRPYYDSTLENWRKHTKKRIELVERLLGLPDLFAFDVPDDEIPHMFKQAGIEGVIHFQERGPNGQPTEHMICGLAFSPKLRSIDCWEFVTCPQCKARHTPEQPVQAEFPVLTYTGLVHYLVEDRGVLRVACDTSGKLTTATTLAASATCPECMRIVTAERAHILRCQRALGRDEK